MKQKFFLLFLCVLGAVSLNAQDVAAKKTPIRLTVEAGVKNSNGDLRDKWLIRQDASSFYAMKGGEKVFTSSNIVYAGVKPEYYFSDKISLSTGVRFTAMLCNIESSNFFFMNYRNDDTGIYLAEVIDMYEQNFYMGIPVEVRFAPVQGTRVGLYLRFGIEAALAIYSDIDINFTDKAMNGRESQILNKKNTDVNDFYSATYSAVGIRIGKQDGINLNLELMLPSFILTSNNSALLDLDPHAAGIQASMQFPLNSKKK
jgi:hypothetical protein